MNSRMIEWLVLLLGGCAALAHEIAPGDLAGKWLFWPDYTLPGKAANYAGPRPEYPTTAFAAIDIEAHPVMFFGERPTVRVARL